jgi:hypothetical protein
MCGGDGTRVCSVVVEVKEIPLSILNPFLFSFSQLKCRLYVFFHDHVEECHMGLYQSLTYSPQQIFNHYFLLCGVMFLLLSASWSSCQSFRPLIMRSRVRFPVLQWGFFLEGEDSHGEHGLGCLVVFRCKALPGTPYPYITIHLIGTT